MDDLDKYFSRLRSGPFTNTPNDPNATAYESQGGAGSSPLGHLDEMDAFSADYVTTQVYNGSFSSLPPKGVNTNLQIDDGGSYITSNLLPGWWGSPVSVSGSAITFQVVVAAAGGYNVRMTMVAGAAGDEAYIERIERISSSLFRAFSIVAAASCTAAIIGSAGLAKAYCIAQFLKADGTTTTGSAGTDSGTLTSIQALWNEAWPAQAYPANGLAPEDAAFVRIRLGMKRDAAANGAAGACDFSDVSQVRGPIRTLLPDSNDPSTYTAGRISQYAGAITILPDALSSTYPKITLNSVTGNIGLLAESGAGSVLVLEQTAPASVPSGYYGIYAKSDGILYGLNDSGTEVALGHSSTGKTVIRPSISGTVDDWNPTGLAHDVVIFIDLGGSNRTITGIHALADGATLYIASQTSTNTITLSHLGGATPANQIRCPAGADYVIGNKAGVTIIYDATDQKWRIFNHA